MSSHTINQKYAGSTVLTYALEKHVPDSADNDDTAATWTLVTRHMLGDGTPGEAIVGQMSDMKQNSFTTTDGAGRIQHYTRVDIKTSREELDGGADQATPAQP